MLHALPVLHHSQPAPGHPLPWSGVMSGPGTVLGQSQDYINNISSTTPQHLSSQWPAVPVLGKTGILE